MPRKRKQDIKVNNSDSLEGLMQEVYNDACTQMMEAQTTINELSTSVPAEDVDDITKIAKEKSNAQKLKDSAIKVKLEVARLQADIIKHNGNLDETNSDRVSRGAPSLDDFKRIREIVKNSGSDNDDSE